MLKLMFKRYVLFKCSPEGRRRPDRPWVVLSILSPELVICEDEIINIDILRSPVLNLSILSNLTMFIHTLDVRAPLV